MAAAHDGTFVSSDFGSCSPAFLPSVSSAIVEGWIRADSKRDEKWLDQHAEASKEWRGVRVMRMLVVDPAPFLACLAATPPSPPDFCAVAACATARSSVLMLTPFNLQLNIIYRHHPRTLLDFSKNLIFYIRAHSYRHDTGSHSRWRANISRLDVCQPLPISPLIVGKRLL